MRRFPFDRADGGVFFLNEVCLIGPNGDFYSAAAATVKLRSRKKNDKLNFMAQKKDVEAYWVNASHDRLQTADFYQTSCCHDSEARYAGRTRLVLLTVFVVLGFYPLLVFVCQ